MKTDKAMRWMGWMLAAASLPGVGLGQAECFRTVRGALVQRGVRDGEGFRLEGVTADRVGGGNWARVVACTHPERPGMVVKVERAADESVARKGSSAAADGARGKVVVAAGTTVRVVRVEAMSRMEMAGVAQADGGVGERVRVRVASEGEARFVSGVVRGEGLVEMDGAQ